MVTVNCPSTTTGADVLGTQFTAETRLAVDCKLNPVALAGHVKTTLVPDDVMLKVGCGGELVPKARLNTVP